MRKVHKKSAQEIQDDIFRKMTTEQKILTGSVLWKMAKNIASDKINYASKRL
ncbi:MAG: hypothetical protein UR27_C0007G0090 [Candidatus Peregrinibacteria bacterium GW2011_GWA2_33_10]|nr:MAG: hypothetical protein UR27_C0007G0090 [Candidatus Peregrinibacteria bacterium GW2011_GWA2_33_10]KKP40849.1 MAG: hypothetical protein UR30_C0003G0021 [Candidatus Peregrinibacteria bacterium GW2011_GWC2_33_13]